MVYYFNSLSPGQFFMFLSSADFFQNQLFRKILSGIPPECQTDWTQIRPNILSGLIWVQSVCKGYEQTTRGVLLKYFSALVIHDGDEAEESLETEHDKRKRAVSYTNYTDQVPRL